MDVIVHDAVRYQLKVIFLFCSVQYVDKTGFKVLLLHHITPLDTAAHDVVGVLGQLYAQFPCHGYSSVFLL